MRVRELAIVSLLLSGVLPASALEMTVRGQARDVPVCGGFAGIPCNDKQWCNYPPGSACGAGDQFGVCRARPDLCPEIEMPVCGCDGKTYGNACKAARDGGTDVAYAGACGRSGQK